MKSCVQSISKESKNQQIHYKYVVERELVCERENMEVNVYVRLCVCTRVFVSNNLNPSFRHQCKIPSPGCLNKCKCPEIVLFLNNP